MVSPRGRRTDPAVVAISAVAPTVVDLDSGRVATQIKDRTAPVRRPRSGGNTGLLLLVLVAAAAAAVYFVKFRPGTGGGTSEQGSAVPIVVGPGSDAIDAPIAPIASVVIDAAVPAVVIDAAETTVPAIVDAPELAAIDAVEDIEIEMDPAVATNPNPTADEVIADEEADDAPEPTADVEAKLPQAEARAQTIREAVEMIKDGKRDLALSSLHALGKKSPKSGYISFLLGNLYYDKLWWGVALEQYKAAIKKHAGYKANTVLIKNTIRMLASPRTRRTADGLLRHTIRRPAVPHLRTAAKNDPNGNVRKAAAGLAKSIR